MTRQMIRKTLLKMKYKKFIIGAAILTLAATIPCAVLTGCGSNMEADNLTDDTKPTKIDTATITNKNNVQVTDFAVRLFQASETSSQNTLISPLSVLYALSMTANGAQSDTLAQMEQVLGMSVEELNTYLHSYINQLPEDNKYSLKAANSIWFTDRNGFTADEDFLQITSDYYGADIYQAPFDSTTVKDINNWVKDHTDDMIPAILKEIPAEAVMYLVNALAFQGEWEEIYRSDQIRENTFTREDKTQENVEFMYCTEGSYLEDDQAEGFIKYYKDRKYAFVALLPEEGMTVSDYVASLNGEKLNQMLTDAEAVKVYTSIPKFKVEYDTELAGTLKEMGMPDAFDESKADFTGLGSCSMGNVYINKVLHKTYIAVDEKGTKAGAATAVEMTVKGVAMDPEDTKKVYLDRPFVYMLIDCEHQIPFFMGTVMGVEGM